MGSRAGLRGCCHAPARRCRRPTGQLHVHHQAGSVQGSVHRTLGHRLLQTGGCVQAARRGTPCAPAPAHLGGAFVALVVVVGQHVVPVGLQRVQPLVGPGACASCAAHHVAAQPVLPQGQHVQLALHDHDRAVRVAVQLVHAEQGAGRAWAAHVDFPHLPVLARACPAASSTTVQTGAGHAAEAHVDDHAVGPGHGDRHVLLHHAPAAIAHQMGAHVPGAQRLLDPRPCGWASTWAPSTCHSCAAHGQVHRPGQRASPALSWWLRRCAGLLAQLAHGPAGGSWS